MFCMKSKVIKIIIILLAIIAVAFALREMYVGIYVAGQNGRSFDKEIAELFLPASPSSYSKAQDILLIADKAFSDINGRSDYGMLGRYSIDNEKVKTEDHSIQLLTARFNENIGYMWVLYYHIGYNSSGEIEYGSGSNSIFDKILSRWELEKIDDKWTVVDITEQP